MARRANKFMANLCQCDNPVIKMLRVCNVPCSPFYYGRPME